MVERVNRVGIVGNEHRGHGMRIRWSLVDHCKNLIFYSKWNGGAIGDFELKKQHDLMFVENLLWV